MAKTKIKPKRIIKHETLNLRDPPLFARVLKAAKKRGLTDKNLSEIARMALTEWCRDGR